MYKFLKLKLFNEIVNKNDKKWIWNIIIKNNEFKILCIILDLFCIIYVYIQLTNIQILTCFTKLDYFIT